MYQMGAEGGSFFAGRIVLRRSEWSSLERSTLHGESNLSLAGRNRLLHGESFFAGRVVLRRPEASSLKRSSLHGDSLPRRSESSLFLAGRNRRLLQGKSFFAGRNIHVSQV